MHSQLFLQFMFHFAKIYSLWKQSEGNFHFLFKKEVLKILIRYQFPQKQITNIQRNCKLASKGLFKSVFGSKLHALKLSGNVRFLLLFTFFKSTLRNWKKTNMNCQKVWTAFGQQPQYINANSSRRAAILKAYRTNALLISIWVEKECTASKVSQNCFLQGIDQTKVDN